MDARELRPILPIWLWPESDGYRLWTPDATYRYANLMVADTPEDWRRATRDGQAQIRLEAVLQPLDCARQLADLLRTPGKRPLLLLADRQPESGTAPSRRDDPLQALPFENLWLDGAPVRDLAVARHVPLTATPAAPAATGPVLIADLWPREAGVPRPLAGLSDTHPVLRATLRILPGPGASRTAILDSHPDNYAALVVFCHGRENDEDGQTPLTDPQRQPWNLPTANGLPPLVILLACGTDGGNLIRYARDLLAHGARAVIAPFGQLDAPPARGFLEVFLLRWLAGERLDLALLAAQGEGGSDWGARRLAIVGDPGLRCAAERQLAERTDEELAALCQDETDQAVAALALLAERLTLWCFQQGKGLDHARKRLLEMSGIRRGDDAAERGLFQRLDHVYANAAPGRLTQLWLAPWLAQLAEQHDHERLDFYESQRRVLMPVADLAPAIAYHDWNRVAYRRGRYAEALEDVLWGLRTLPADQLWPDGAPLVRDLANLLIEFDLPAAARTVARHLDARLGGLTPSEALATERYKLLDTHARACLRGGEWRAALGLFRRKREETRRRTLESTANHPTDTLAGAGLRELAWMLYAASWGQPDASDTARFADEARALLRDAATFRATLDGEQGNSDRLYLLRAFAAWVWRSANADDAELLLGYRDLLENEFYVRQDAGPLGFVIGYLNLYARLPGGRLDDQPCWDAARESLRAERYYLEAASFAALLGDSEQAAESLDLFQSQCADFPSALERMARDGTAMAALGIVPATLTEWAEEARVRRALERECLTQDADPCPSKILGHGLLPL